MISTIKVLNGATKSTTRTYHRSLYNFEHPILYIHLLKVVEGSFIISISISFCVSDYNFVWNQYSCRSVSVLPCRSHKSKDEVVTECWSWPLTWSMPSWLFYVRGNVTVVIVHSSVTSSVGLSRHGMPVTSYYRTLLYSFTVQACITVWYKEMEICRSDKL